MAPPSATIESTIPARQLEIEDSARAILTTTNSRLLNELAELLNCEARRRNIEVARMVVRGFVDPEEGDSTLVIMQHVRLSPDEADVHWDSLEQPLEDWLRSLSNRDSETVRRGFSVRVRSASP